MFLVKVPLGKKAAASLSKTQTPICSSVIYRTMLLLWSHCHHFWLQDIMKCKTHWLILFTLLIVIRTSFCCLQEAQCYPNDTYRVQQEITLPETNMILLPEWCTARLPNLLPCLPPTALLTWNVCIPHVSTCKNLNQKRTQTKNPPISSYFLI